MKPGLELCGLGAFPSRDAPVAALDALASCGAVFSDLADGASFEWLKGLCPGLRRARGAAQIVEAAARRRTGLAVWGHPLYSSRLGRQALNAARSGGVEVRVHAAVSAAGGLLSLGRRFLGGAFGHRGLRSFELGTLLDTGAPPDGRLPAALFAEAAAPGEWERAQRALLSAYPAKHPCTLYLLEEDGPRAIRLDGLSRAARGGGLLWLPPLGRPR